MSTEPTKPESDHSVSEDDKVEIVPVAGGLIAERTTMGLNVRWSTPLRSSFKNQGPRNPYLGFNNFRALKRDFGSNICLC